MIDTYKNACSILMIATILCCVFSVGPAGAFETDTFHTDSGDISITFLGHGSLMLAFDGLIVHIDPWGKVADYSALPDADILLLTHHHQDHLDPEALKEIVTDDTATICTERCAKAVKHGEITVASYGDIIEVEELHIETVPAYNLDNLKNPGGHLVHPKGIGNGYIVSFGGLRLYFASETEFVPELKVIEDIDVLFIAVDAVYNMTPSMAAEFVKALQPKIFYPIHYADADMNKLAQLLDDSGTELRLREMK